MNPDDLSTLITLLGQDDPGGSKTPSLVGAYSGGYADPSQTGGAATPQYGASSIIPNPANQKPKSLGLFESLPPGMLGQSPYRQGMLGQSPPGW